MFFFKELDFKELGVLGYSDLLGLGVLGYSDLLGLGVPKETIRRRLFEGDYSKEWHLVPELWYLNYGT